MDHSGEEATETKASFCKGLLGTHGPARCWGLEMKENLPLSSQFHERYRVKPVTRECMRGPALSTRYAFVETVSVMRSKQGELSLHGLSVSHTPLQPVLGSLQSPKSQTGVAPVILQLPELVTEASPARLQGEAGMAHSSFFLCFSLSFSERQLK